MRPPQTRPARRAEPAAGARRSFLHRSLRASMSGAAVLLAAGGAMPARALAAVQARPLPRDARSLAFSHTHTGERLSITYAVGDRYLPEALRALEHLLRDHYNGAVGSIDPRLLDQLHALRAALGPSQAFEVISAYRSPATNERLRRTRGGGVASRSLHLDGRAIDVRLPGVELADLRDAALDLRAGGVGFYPRERFVHLDTGAVRRW